MPGYRTTTIEATTIKEWLDQQFSPRGEHPAFSDCGTVAYALVGSILYAAYRGVLRRDPANDEEPPEDGCKRTFAIVIAFESGPPSRGAGAEFGRPDVESFEGFRAGATVAWRVYDEFMGPHYYDCPARVFDALDPLDGLDAIPPTVVGYARTWRALVRARLDRAPAEGPAT